MCDFIARARLDFIGVFGYSDEDGTEAEGHDAHLDQDVIDARVAALTELVDELCNQRAEERIGETVEVLVESIDGAVVEGRAAHQGPEVDGTTRVTGVVGAAVGSMVRAVVTGVDGVDLIAEAL